MSQSDIDKLARENRATYRAEHPLNHQIVYYRSGQNGLEQGEFDGKAIIWKLSYTAHPPEWAVRI